MSDEKTMAVFEKAPVPAAVLKNAVPAMAAMLMVLVYNLADTFFIGQTHDDFQVAAVSLATPVFLIFMAVGTIFGIGGTSVISRALGEGRPDYAKKVCSFCMWSCVIVGVVMTALFLVFMDQILMLVGASPDTMGPAKHRLEIQTLQHQACVAQGRFDSGQERGNVVNCFLQFTASFILQNIETP